MTSFPTRQNLLMVESRCPFYDSSNAADHFAAIQSPIAESHNSDAERERRRERPEAPRQMDRKYNGIVNLSIGSRTISTIKQFGFDRLSIHSR